MPEEKKKNGVMWWWISGAVCTLIVTTIAIMTRVFGFGLWVQNVNAACYTVNDKEIGNAALDKRLEKYEEVYRKIDNIDKYIKRAGRQED